MDNFMHRGGRMLGSSKLYGSNRPQGNEWRSENSRMVDASRPYKDSQIQETSRQREGFRMQDSRLLMESGLEQNYSPPRIFNVSEVQGSGRIPDRPHGGTQLQREVRVHQDSRMESGNRLQENSRMYNMPPQDHLEPRSSTVAYDYNHRRSNDADSFKDIGTQSKFMNSHENMRSGRNYILEENESAKQEFLGTLPKNNSLKKNLELLSAQSRHGSVITPGPSHILTPSLTTSPGHPTGIGMRPIGNRESYPKEKSSKAFDYLKTWRLKMNMPTDSFLLEKEGIVGNQQQGVDVIPPLACDDWYTQPPTTEPRRASIDPEWNCSGNSFADKETYGERPGNKYGNMRYGSYGESLVDCPKGQSLESDRTGNPPWKWAEELPSGQNEGAKRNYESMALGQSFNHANRDGRLLHDTVQPKRPRLSPSIMESERRGNMEQYTSVISEQANLSQNVMESDDAKIRIGASNTFYEPQSDWISPFHSKPLMDSSRFSRSCDNESESVSFRHKLPYGEMKGVGARERSQTSYIHSRDVKSVPHLSTERSPEPLGRHKYTELQDQASRFSGQGAPRELNQGPLNQERPLPGEMFMPSAPYSLEMSPRSYHGIRSHRSPGKVKSPGLGARGKSPPLFSQRKSQGTVPRGKYSGPNARNRSSPWRKGRSPGPGRDRAPRPERGRSPGYAGLEPSTGRRLPSPAGRPRPISIGQQRSSCTQERPGIPKGERSPELGRVKPSAPRRGRSPGHQIRERSPGPTRRERLPASPGRGRLLDHGRWSPGRLPAHSGREKSPEPFRRERPPASAERRKSPLLLGKGTSHGVSSVGGRSPGPLGGQSSRPLERGRPTGKSHVGRRSSPGASEKGKLPSEMSSKSGRGKSPGPERSRSSGIPGRVRSPGADGSYRLPRLPGKGKQTDGSGRRSPRQLNTGKPSKTVKGGSTEQQQPRSVSAATGVSVDRKVAEGEQSRSSQHSRGRSPLKGRSPVGTRMRSESFRDGKQRPRIRNRSPQSPVKDHRGKNEALYPSEYRDYKMKNDRSPYLEEVSLSPRASRYLSPTGRGMMNIRSHHSRERSLSADALQRECSPVSVQLEDNQHQNIYPQEPCFAAKKRASAKCKSTVTPLMVTSEDFTNSDDFRKEVESDTTLYGVRNRLQENSVLQLNDDRVNFIKQRGLIYRQLISPSGERKVQLVVPAKYREAVLKLAHSIALGGHMRKAVTLARVEAYFYWPGIGQEVARFVKSCDVCQEAKNKGMTKPAHLQPMPIIDSPFERVAVDLVGPIEPRASDGSRYILTLVDFATRWAEAVPLKNTETQTVAEALMTVFCRVGIPKQILSDRGTQVTKAMMEEVLCLLACKGLCITPYHTIGNRLCESLNSTLKKILKHMVAEQPKEWPRYLAPLLFAYREAPQSCTRFSPFQLMHGSSVRGPLQLLRELWDDDVPDPTVKNTYQYVLDLGNRLRETCNIAKEVLLKAKQIQKSLYERKVKLRRLTVGEQCLVLLPTASNKLIAQWKGPYEVQEKVNDVSYVVMVDGHPKRFYINMLKQYYGPEAAAGCLRESGYDDDKVRCPKLVKALYFQPQIVDVGAALVINDDEDDEAPLTVSPKQTESVDDMKLGEKLAPELGTIASLLESYGELLF